jgi:hypothetical protein
MSLVSAAIFLHLGVAIALGQVVAAAPLNAGQATAGPPVQTPDSAAPTRFYYFTTPRSTLETEVHSIPPPDTARFSHLKDAFADAGCSGDSMKVQQVADKANAPPNLICAWPGKTAFTIVVVAHYPHTGKGQGAVENWSGAILLPYLYRAGQAQPRENTWVFLESGGKSGSEAYIKSLSREQKRQIRAVIALDALGVGPVARYYTPNPDNTPWLPGSSVHLQMALMFAILSDNRVPRPEQTSPLRWLSIDDSQPFRYSSIPSIFIHSIPDKDASIPGSGKDTASAIDPNAYYQNYRAIAVYLIDLDGLASKLKSGDPVWHGVGGQYHLDKNDLPIPR